MPDEHTVVFVWDAPYAYYAGLFEAMLPEHVLGGMSAQEIVDHTPYNRGDALVGTGPFRFVEWRAGEYILVERNPDYWRNQLPEGDRARGGRTGTVPAIDRIVWSFVPDQNTRFNALKAGDYHYGQITPTQVEEMEGVEGYRVVLVSSNSFMHFDLSLNTPNAEALFSDRTVRRALFHAIDRQAIAQQLFRGTVRVADSPLNTTSPYFSAAPPASTFDPEEADWEEMAAGLDRLRLGIGDRFCTS